VPSYPHEETTQGQEKPTKKGKPQSDANQMAAKLIQSTIRESEK